jgi:hypothetical protein
MDKIQVLRFAVGSGEGNRSRVWRLWVPKGKSDVYLSAGGLGDSLKVSLHEPGPSRFALTQEFIDKKQFKAPNGHDSRLAQTFNRASINEARPAAQALTIVIPFDEVRSRPGMVKNRDIVWVPVPADQDCIHIVIVYIAPGIGNLDISIKGPYSRKGLIGDVLLANNQRVRTAWFVRPLSDALGQKIRELRTMPLVDRRGNALPPANGMFCFAKERIPIPPMEVRLEKYWI